MTIFQFICKCYAITCNTVKYISFFVKLVCPFIAEFLTESLQNLNLGHWQTQLPVAEQYVTDIFGISPLIIVGLRSNFCFGKSKMKSFYFVKKTKSSRHDSKLSIADISLTIWLSHKLVTEIMVVQGIIQNIRWRWRSLWPLGQWQGKFFFFYRLVCPFITPSILDRISSN